MIEIVSFPGPVRSVTKAQLESDRVTNRRYRNRRIGEFLKELHLTEGRNTGFKKILDAITANGSPLPVFETDDEHSYFISRFFIHEAFLENDRINDQNDRIKGENDRINDQNDRINDQNHITNEKINSTELRLDFFSDSRKKTAKAIIEILLKDDQVTVPQIAENIQVSETTVRRYIRKMKEKGIVERRGANKNGKWIVL